MNHDFILGNAPSKDKRQALDDISRIQEPCIKSLKKKVKLPKSSKGADLLFPTSVNAISNFKFVKTEMYPNILHFGSGIEVNSM